MVSSSLARWPLRAFRTHSYVAFLSAFSVPSRSTVRTHCLTCPAPLMQASMNVDWLGG